MGSILLMVWGSQNLIISLFIYLFIGINTFVTWAKIGKRSICCSRPWFPSVITPAPCPPAEPPALPQWPGLGVMHASSLPVGIAPVEDSWFWNSFPFHHISSEFSWIIFKFSSSLGVSLVPFLQLRAVPRGISTVGAVWPMSTMQFFF